MKAKQKRKETDAVEEEKSELREVLPAEEPAEEGQGEETKNFSSRVLEGESPRKTPAKS